MLRQADPGYVLALIDITGKYSCVLTCTRQLYFTDFKRAFKTVC